MSLVYKTLLTVLFVCLNSALIFDGPVPDVTRYDEIKYTLEAVLQHKRHGRRWTRLEIDKTAWEIELTERALGEHFVKILTTIEVESQFKYWVRGGTNQDGTHDIGLTQQNSDYYQYRCQRTLGRKCRRWELFVPWISVALMRQRFRECRGCYGEDLFLCYNSKAIIGRDSRYRTLWRKSYYKVLKIWQKVKRRLPERRIKVMVLMWELSPQLSSF